jgi:hypothetical protein
MIAISTRGCVNPQRAHKWYLAARIGSFPYKP